MIYTRRRFDFAEKEIAVTARSSAPAATSSKKSPVVRWDPAWSAGLRIWVERRGKAVLGEGRADLLAGIDRMHSISGAARAMKMSYRHAWLMVQAVNAAAGEPFVESAVGGLQGGGARLTERGRAALQVFQELADDVRRHAAVSLGRIVARGAATAASATIVHLAAAVSLQEAVGQILTEYALVRPTTSVRALFGASNELAEQIAAGAPIDLFLTGDVEHVGRLAAPARGGKSPAPRSLAKNGLAVIVPLDTTLTATNLKELARSEVQRPALADPACPLGKATWAYLERLGLADRFRARAVIADNSRGVLSAVRSGRADVGIAFSSDAAPAGDCRVLFPVRAKQASTDYFGVVTHAGRQSEEAAELLDFFRSESARRCFRRCGLSV